jgi:hypothetical protein
MVSAELANYHVGVDRSGKAGRQLEPFPFQRAEARQRKVTV